MKYRQYEYKCKRCSEVFTERDLRPAEMVEWHIRIISIPDEFEERAIKNEYGKDYLGDIAKSSFHECKDGGYGIGELIGCGAEEEE